MPAEMTPRDAVNRALAAMEIAESCLDPTLRNAFTELAGTWLREAEAAAGEAKGARRVDGVAGRIDS